MEFVAEPTSDSVAAYYWMRAANHESGELAPFDWHPSELLQSSQSSINPLLILREENDVAPKTEHTPDPSSHNYQLLSFDDHTVQAVPPHLIESPTVSATSSIKSSSSVVWMEDHFSEPGLIPFENTEYITRVDHLAPQIHRPGHKRTVSEPVFGTRHARRALPKVTMKDKSESCVFDAAYWSDVNRRLPVPCEEDAPPLFQLHFVQTTQQLERTSLILTKYLEDDYDLVEQLRSERDYTENTIEMSTKRRKLGDNINWKPMSAGSVLGLNEVFKLHQREVSAMLQNCTQSCFGELNMRELRAWRRGDGDLKRRQTQPDLY
ncbi:hypothetical protein OGAPHI_000579 [Ogataea philodendri]|uniref:Uncharacterized protein n=1 Tax=Ogataea philodendri TaxID=1378263 RepID=A0A9P8PEN5_9ASCO|nr:uncharacterized protein OGAPHI_000579 [Ogataea philodendri]KAH3670868.1 hypothetical protein OGAPHI_000579 [Ogataea philodendri]